MKTRERWMVATCMAGLACGDAGAGPDTPSNRPETAADAAVDPDEPAAPRDGPQSACDVPSQPAELLAYLQRGEYKAFERESAVHPSTGPHGGRVLTYVNAVLSDSLARGDAEHPRCAASVKELFLGNREVSGWAVFVKTDNASAGGKGYYWLEILGTQPDRSADYEGQGIGICVGCHSAGRDYFRAPWPLQ